MSMASVLLHEDCSIRGPSRAICHDMLSVGQDKPDLTKSLVALTSPAGMPVCTACTVQKMVRNAVSDISLFDKHRLW